MKGERGRRHKKMDRSVVAREPLHDEIEVQLEVGRAILLLHGAETKPVHVTVVPGEVVKIRCGPTVRHRASSRLTNVSSPRPQDPSRTPRSWAPARSPLAGSRD